MNPLAALSAKSLRASPLCELVEEHPRGISQIEERRTVGMLQKMLVRACFQLHRLRSLPLRILPVASPTPGSAAALAASAAADGSFALAIYVLSVSDLHDPYS